MTMLEVPDDGIPVLTEIVLPDALAGARSIHDAALENTQRLYAIAPPEQSTHNAAPAVPAITTAGAETADPDAWLDELSLRVQSRVLAGLTARIDPIVEQRLRESLTDLLEQVLAGMTAELKITARNIVRDAVAQAVAAELAELHKPPG